MRILVADDDEGIRDFLRQALKSENFAVDGAKDGEEGIYLACTNEYDLLILDNRMPRKGGLAVCEAVRAAGKGMPILVLSVDAEPAEKASLLNAGADDYMAKPFSLNELLARVRALLRRPRSIESEELTLDSLTLNTRTHKVMRAGREIHLTRKEYMLLQYLARNRGTVLSRGMIMEHVWDMNADPFSNTIESHIVSLRRKIELPGETKLIHTVSGRGYTADVR